ncbi:MAG TPA: AI-2E family transporter [Gaiellaceae bacterium]
MKETAQRVALSTLIVIAIVAVALALWKLKLVLALVFLAFILAAALRPGIERLARAGVPRGLGLLIHYVVLIGVIGLALWIVVPRAVDQVQSALGGTTKAQIHQEAKQSKGIKHDVLTAIDKRLREVPKTGQLLHPAVEVTLKVFEVLLGIFFVLATAAYWIFERARAVDFVASLLSRPKRKKLRDTWDLIDLKLGAFVRGQVLLIALVGTVLSLAFWAIGEPYFILIGAFAGVVEIVPVIGPISAGALAVAVGATDSWHVAVAAGVCVLVVRLFEDYLIVAARARRRRRPVAFARTGLGHRGGNPLRRVRGRPRGSARRGARHCSGRGRARCRPGRRRRPDRALPRQGRRDVGLKWLRATKVSVRAPDVGMNLVGVAEPGKGSKPCASGRRSSRRG